MAQWLNGGQWKLVAAFTEIQSGRRKTRPELAKALAACKQQKAKLVVAKLDRLTRDVGFLVTLLDSGVDVLFCDLPELGAGAMARFMLTQMAAVAELEAGLVGERTKAALRQGSFAQARQGRFNGSVCASGTQKTPTTASSWRQHPPEQHDATYDCGPSVGGTARAREQSCWAKALKRRPASCLNRT